MEIQNYQAVTIQKNISNGGIWTVLFVGLMMFFGCKNKPQYPVSYGLYIKSGNQWAQINPGDNWINTTVKPEILVFARELSFTPNINQEISLQPTLWVKQNVELLQSSANASPNGYSLEPAKYHAILTDRQVRIPIKPVPDHNDMVILSSTENLTKGYYVLKTPIGNVRCAIGIGSPEELQAANVVDKWYYTLDERSASPMENFMTLSQKELGQERAFHGHAIIRSEFHPQGDLQALHDRVVLEVRMIVKNSPDLSAVIAAARKLLPLDNNIGNSLLNEARTRINKKISELKDSKDWWSLSSFTEIINSDQELRSTHSETLTNITHEIELIDNDIKDRTADFLIDSKKLGANVSSFESADRLTKEKHSVSIHENGIVVVHHGFFGGEEKETIWMRDIGSLDKQWEYGVVAPFITSLGFNGIVQGQSERHFFFNDSSSRDQFLEAVDKARIEWTAKNAAMLSVKYLGRPNVYGEKIWVKDCSYEFDTTDKSASYEVLADGNNVYAKAPGVQDLHINSSEYIQLRSTCGKIVSFDFNLFPYKKWNSELQEKADRKQVDLQCTTSKEYRQAQQELNNKHYQEAKTLLLVCRTNFPKSLTVCNTLAWLLATCPEDSVRDGKIAVETAKQACELAYWKDAGVIDTLAAAYAEAGEFDSAVAKQQEATKLAEVNNTNLNGAEDRLKLYQRKRSLHAEN